MTGIRDLWQRMIPSSASMVKDPPTDPEADPILQHPEEVPPFSLLHSDEMLIRTVHEWYEYLEFHQRVLDDWVVTKVEHTKNFHYSWVLHEYLRVTVRRRRSLVSPGEVSPQDGEKVEIDKCTIYVERGGENDEVTVGCQPHEVPKLYGWWVVRYLRGNYNNGEGPRWPTEKTSSTRQWRELGYSASDFLRSLDFDQGIQLLDFAKTVQFWSSRREQYNLAKANCYWFANMVYTHLKCDAKSTHSEFEGGYIKHKNMFSGLRILRHSEEKEMQDAIDALEDGKDMSEVLKPFERW